MVIVTNVTEVNFNYYLTSDAQVAKKKKKIPQVNHFRQ
jgi:hypothetical protein